MRKLVLLCNLLLTLLVLVGDVFYICNGKLWVKSITSIGFVLIAMVNFIYLLKNNKNNLSFAIFMLTGLTFAMLGDILLEVEFIVGAILFAIGHIFYFIAYTKLVKFSLKDLIFAICIFIPASILILFAPIFDYDTVVLKILCVVYALIISIMVGKAVSNFIKSKTSLNLILMIGSMLFMFSDLMLLFSHFGSVPVTGILCLATYYPAEILLAYSILHGSK